MVAFDHSDRCAAAAGCVLSSAQRFRPGQLAATHNTTQQVVATLLPAAPYIAHGKGQFPVVVGLGCCAGRSLYLRLAQQIWNWSAAPADLKSY